MDKYSDWTGGISPLLRGVPEPGLTDRFSTPVGLPGTPSDDEAADIAWGQKIAPLMKPIGGGRTPEQIAADDKLFSTPSYRPQLLGQGGINSEDTPSSGPDWDYAFSAFADAGAALQGRQGTTLSSLMQRRQNQAELQQKQEQAKRQQSMDDLKLFNEMLKMPRAVREKASNRIADPILRDMAKYWKDQDVELYSKVALPFLSRYRPGEAKVLEDALAAGELNGEMLKSHWELNKPSLEQFKKLQDKEVNLARLQRQIEANPSLKSDAGFMDAIRVMEEDVQGINFELLGKKQAIEKGARENRIGAATEDQARIQAILKTAQDAQTLGQRQAEAPLDIRLKNAQISAAEQARAGSNDPNYQRYRNDLHDIETTLGLKVPLLDAAGNFNPQALAGGGVDMKIIEKAIDRYVNDKSRPESVREYMRQFKATILEPEVQAARPPKTAEDFFKKKGM